MRERLGDVDGIAPRPFYKLVGGLQVLRKREEYKENDDTIHGKKDILGRKWKGKREAYKEM